MCDCRCFHLKFPQETALDIDQALFQPFPSEVVFQQFEPHQSYEFPLALRNNDKVQSGVHCSTRETALLAYRKVRCISDGPSPLHQLLRGEWAYNTYFHAIGCCKPTLVPVPSDTNVDKT